MARGGIADATGLEPVGSNAVGVQFPPCQPPMRQTTATVQIGWHSALNAIEKIIETGDVNRFAMEDVFRLYEAHEKLLKRLREANTYAYNRFLDGTTEASLTRLEAHEDCMRPYLRCVG